MVPPPVAGAPQQEPKSTRWRLEYPLQTILGAAFVLLLGFAFTQTNDRRDPVIETGDPGQCPMGLTG